MALDPIIFKFRTEDSGGELLQPPAISGPPIKRSRLVLLIHGYNNNVQEAQAAYKGFYYYQQKLAADAPGGDFAPDRDFIEVYWKGDDWGVASPLYYMNAIPYAIKTAKALADELKKCALTSMYGYEIEIVAHSLGTRLALELLKYLGPGSRIDITRIVFFAAASATFMLNDASDSHGLRKAYDSVVTDGLKSLYSGNDIILSMAFPIGQSLASGKEGFFPTALGHEYWASPNCPFSLQQSPNPGANHWDYWGWKKDKTECEAYANQETRDYLGFTGMGDRTVPNAAIAERDTIEAELPVSRIVNSRESAIRQT